MGNRLSSRPTSRRARRTGLSPYQRHAKREYEYHGEAKSFREYVRKYGTAPNTTEVQGNV